MIQFSDQEIANERLILDSATELYYLGHHLTLRRCTLVIKVPARALVIAHTRLIDCTLEVKRELIDFRWDRVHLQGCQFKGRFTGNDFGEWPSSPGQGSIVNCDFSQAHLTETRFLGCDARTIRFPPWPCFTIFDPVHRAHELRKLPWPGAIGRSEIALCAEDPPSTVALTLSATALAKQRGTTPEAIKAVLETMGGVFY